MGMTRMGPAPGRVLVVCLSFFPALLACTSEPAGVVEVPVVVPPFQRGCTPARSSEKIPLRRAATRAPVTENFDNLLARVGTQCASCHLPPNIQGGFQYTADLEGLKRDGARMALKASQGEMPPRASPQQLKEAVELSCALNAWLARGSPTGTFPVVCEASSEGGVTVAREVGDSLTDIGNCIPQVAKDHPLGSDPQKDTFFAGLTKLPRFLSETDSDIVTFDADTLADHGTVAFAPTYPLFSDNAKKLRLVHVPQGQSIRYDEQTQKFHIPPNTRFYKTFFKSVTDLQGQRRYRKMETRLIIVREPWNQSLFGTYLWNEDETVAELHDLRYRNNEPFSDRVLVYKAYEIGGATRNYAIPGAHRCIQCHTGSEAQNFILGFTPLQLNRRAPGEAGVDAKALIDEDELNQMDRLVRYGVITGVPAYRQLEALETSLPRLERFAEAAQAEAPSPEAHKATLELQGYFVGNCGQCHNPNGFAVRSNPAIASLDFSAGGVLFGWKPCGVKESNGQRVYVDCEVKDYSQDLLLRTPSSTLYQRVARDTDARVIHMPTNVPGKDCRASLLVARYIAALDWPADKLLPPAQQAEARQARLRQADTVVAGACTDPSDVQWIAEDFTDKVPYEPRNPAWKDAIGQGEFEYLTRYAITERHEQLARKLFPTNWWLPKRTCRFPQRDSPPAGHDPWNDSRDKWMVNALGNPRAPWGELYYTTPGATAFQGICSNCHGRVGDGQTGAAKVLVALNGGRVANLVAGLFGSRDGVSHLTRFDSINPHGGARYLAYMASGGTAVQFTPEFMSAWIKYGEVDIDFSPRTSDWSKWGANMLGAGRGACDLIRTGNFGTASAEPPSGNRNAIGGVRMWEEVCSLDNPLTDAVRAGQEPALGEWLQRAQFNVGVMAYFYLRDELSKGPGAIYPLRTECERQVAP
ncbi:hypothetical protein [Myxococcus sp. CA039A]|uniref:hypothetical protein n=1 Tax=Myxococcus sp. CA039A TaxID=2741737 RepID=UPI00157B1E95|nr:hypothetical protein [Myxococcus sp. CA039A]NTX57069.1 hypothetical protein [Myxococcus sp. CA039A]